MNRSDVRLRTMTEDALHAWSDGTAFPDLPVAAEVTLLWLTLADWEPVLSTSLKTVPGAPMVVVLQQGGILTPPEKVWPHLMRHLIQGRHPVWLVLTGGAVLRRYAVWHDWLTFRTHAQPPLRSIFVHVLAGSFLSGPGILPRLILLGMRMLRRVK